MFMSNRVRNLYLMVPFCLKDGIRQNMWPILSTIHIHLYQKDRKLPNIIKLIKWFKFCRFELTRPNKIYTIGFICWFLQQTATCPCEQGKSIKTVEREKVKS